MWNLKVKVIPLITGATGTITGKHEIKETHKTATLGTNVQVQNTFHKLYIENSCNTMYPGNMVCFRYIILNKRDSKYSFIH